MQCQGVMSEKSNFGCNILKWRGRLQFTGGIAVRLQDNPKIMEVAWKPEGGLPRPSQDHSNTRVKFKDSLKML
jgi:hypothetical protein